MNTSALSTSLVRCVARGPVLYLTLADTPRRNVLTGAVLAQLAAHFAEIHQTSDIRAVVLEAEGAVFSAGHDLREVQKSTPEGCSALFEACSKMMLAIRALPVPVIASVRGLATAAGCQLVAACDLAVASETARFQTPGGLIGLFCSTPAVPLVRAIGRKRAMEMLLLAEPIDAPTAAAWGLINRVVPEDQVDQEVERLLASILRLSPEALARGKLAFYQQAEVGEREAYRIASRAMATDAATPDASEGIRAFLEKRQPIWPERHSS